MIDEGGIHRHWDLLLYLGDALHRPVMVGEWRQQFSHEMTAENGQQSRALLLTGPTMKLTWSSHLTVVLSPWSQQTSVKHRMAYVLMPQ